VFGDLLTWFDRLPWDLAGRALDDSLARLGDLAGSATPLYVTLEVIAWAAFGALTYRLVNRPGDRRRESAGGGFPRGRLGVVALFASMLVFAMTSGRVQPASYTVPAWTLPLLSFFLGYAARSLSRVTDRLTGTAAREPAEALGERRALVSQVIDASRPRDLDELRSTLKALTREVVEIGVAERRRR